MAYENVKILEGTQVADADLSAKQFYAVKITATGIDLAGAGDPAVGILQNKPTSGLQCSVGCLGVTKAIAGAVFARGVELMVDANGKLITATTGNKIVATALEAAGADGDIVTVLFEKNGEVA